MNAAHQIDYDGEADALYLTLAKDFVSAVRTVEGVSGVLVDIGTDEENRERVIGLEVLDASRHPVFWALVPQTFGAKVTYFGSFDAPTPVK